MSEYMDHREETKTQPLSDPQKAETHKEEMVKVYLKATLNYYVQKSKLSPQLN